MTVRPAQSASRSRERLELDLMPMSPAVWADDPLAAECRAVGLLRRGGLL